MIVFEHITQSPEERALRARIAARCAALRAEAEAARQVRAAGERRSIVVSPGADPGARRGRARDVQARVVAPPPAAPSVFRALRPGDTIVKLTFPMPTSPPPTTAPLTQGPASPRMEPKPVAAILDRRQTAVARMATWHRGDGPGASAARNVNPGAAPVPTARAITRAEPEPLADLFARRRATAKAARPWMEGN